MARESESQPQSLEVTFDCECMECGYNLRGLSGEPVRCPECGHLNPVHEVQVTPEAIAWQLRRMETPLAVCALAAVVGVPMAGATIYLAVVNPPTLRDGVFPCFPLSSVVSVVAWCVGLVQFRSACEYQAGWARAFWRYQVRAVLSAACVATPTLLIAERLGQYGSNVHDAGRRVWIALSMMLVFAAIIIIAVRGARRLHGRLRETIEPLVRETAMRLAWENMRERMRSARR